MSKRYIDADALISDIETSIETYWNGGGGGYYLAEDVLNYSIKTAPTADVVEVVRCRECKYCHHYVTPTLERYECYYYGCSDEVVNYVEPMHYCAYGERREE